MVSMCSVHFRIVFVSRGEVTRAEARTSSRISGIFSFGLVMYEAFTGQRAFDGESLESIIGRILEAEPKPVTELKPVTPIYTVSGE